MNSDLLSAKALGLLFYITSTDTRISAENLATIFGEGEKAIGSGLKELREKQLIELKHEVINGNVIKFSVITEKGREVVADLIRIPAPSSPYVFTDPRNRQNGDIDTSNEQLSKLILNIYKYKPNTFREDEIVISSEVKTRESHNQSCPNCYLVPKPLDQRMAAELQKQTEYNQKQTKKHRTAYEKRQGRPMNTWSISDVCLEIADRAGEIWSLPPWRLSSSRLVAAFTQVRRKWGTNGEIEIQAFEFFLKRINTNEYPSVDALWQHFIYSFPEILPKVMLLHPTEEDLARREETRLIIERKREELLAPDVNTPSRAETSKKDAEWKRLKQLAHHYRVMYEECTRSSESENAKIYFKALLRTDLDLAIISKNQVVIEDLKGQLFNMSDIYDIPEGEYMI